SCRVPATSRDRGRGSVRGSPKGARASCSRTAAFDFHPETKRIRLKSVHPGTSLEDVMASTRFPHDWVPSQVPVTPSPSAEELRLMREVIDPRAVLLPR